MRLGKKVLQNKFVDQCHFCNYILSSGELRPIVLEVAAQLELELQSLNADAQELALTLGA
jgi:hypothetical protein